MINDGFMFKRKNMFDLLHEAPEDGADAGAEDAETNDNADAPADDAGGDEDTTDMGNDEDFDVDTNIEDGGDDNPDSTEGDDGDLGSDSGRSDMDGGGDEEVNSKNTDIFSTLSKEEQAIKISELKKKFNELYIYISDMYGKINDINVDEDSLDTIYRVTAGLYSTKNYIGDYIKQIFPMKSYIENDIAYNRFLTIIQSITNVINKLSAEIEEKVQKETKK